MRIRCPSCSATYEVADALLENPRTVRCARCAHEWTAEPLSEDQSQPNPAAEVPAEPVRGDQSQPNPAAEVPRVEAGQEGTNPAREPVSESFGSDHALGE